jgi:hypothetical protein
VTDLSEEDWANFVVYMEFKSYYLKHLKCRETIDLGGGPQRLEDLKYEAAYHLSQGCNL